MWYILLIILIWIFQWFLLTSIGGMCVRTQRYLWHYNFKKEINRLFLMLGNWNSFISINSTANHSNQDFWINSRIWYVKWAWPPLILLKEENAKVFIKLLQGKRMYSVCFSTVTIAKLRAASILLLLFSSFFLFWYKFKLQLYWNAGIKFKIVENFALLQKITCPLVSAT